jgi:tetratricopeptide (TPR) repeat protein
MAAAAPQSNRWLFGPVPDILLGCGVAYMAIFAALVFAGPDVRAALPMGLLPLVSVFFGTPHYGATLLRVYEQRNERRAYAFFTVWISLVLAALYVGALYSALLGSFLLSLYLTWSPWHYTGQNYGVTLLFLRRRGIEITPTTKRWIYASFLLSYGLTFLAIHGAAYTADYAPLDYQGSAYRFLRFGIPTPYWAWAWTALGAAYVVSLAMAGRDLLRRASRASDLLPSALVVLTQALWFSLPPLGRELGLLSGVDPFKPDNAGFLFIWVAAGHAAQYLWVTTYYAGPKGTAARVRYYTRCVFAGSAIWSLPAILYVWSGLAGSRYGGIRGDDVGVLVAAMVNLHHFVIDGAIWKLRDGRVARALIRRDPAAAEAVLDRPRVRWLAPILLTAGAAWMLSTVYVLFERDRSFMPALARGDVAAAEASLERLQWLRRAAAVDYQRVARVAAQRDDSETVFRVLDHAIERHGEAPSYQAKATYLEKLGRNDAAIETYRAGSAAHPEEPDLFLGAGRLLLQRGDVEAALAALERAHGLAPTDHRIDLLLERAREKRAAEDTAPSGA